jgi:hypothetical protein
MYYNNIRNLEDNKVETSPPEQLDEALKLPMVPPGGVFSPAMKRRLRPAMPQIEPLPQPGPMSPLHPMHQGKKMRRRKDHELSFEGYGMMGDKKKKKMPMMRDDWDKMGKKKKKMREVEEMHGGPHSSSMPPMMDTGSGMDSVRPMDTGMQAPDQNMISQPPQTGLPMVPAIGNEVLEWFLWFMENGGNMDLGNMGPYMTQIYDIISGIVGGQFNQDGLNMILGNWGEMYA